MSEDETPYQVKPTPLVPDWLALRQWARHVARAAQEHQDTYVLARPTLQQLAVLALQLAKQADSYDVPLAVRLTEVEARLAAHIEGDQRG